MPEFIWARVLIFITTFIVGVYAVFFNRSTYLCSLDEYSCPLCGMTTAIHHAIRFQFQQAHAAHPFVWLVFIIAFLFLADIVFSLSALYRK